MIKIKIEVNYDDGKSGVELYDEGLSGYSTTSDLVALCTRAILALGHHRDNIIWGDE